MPTIEQLLHDSRRELLDLSTRNRLLSMPVESKSARVVHVRDEMSDEVFRLLVGEKKTLVFLPAPEKRGEKTLGDNPKRAEDEDEEDFTWLDEVSANDTMDAATGKAGRHMDTRLQTTLSQEVLHRRLLALFRDARTIEEVHGVNILYPANQAPWPVAFKPGEWVDFQKGASVRRQILYADVNCDVRDLPIRPLCLDARSFQLIEK